MKLKATLLLVALAQLAFAVRIGLAQGNAAPQASAIVQQTATPFGQSLQWLVGPQMEKELDIVPDQRDAIQKLRVESQAKIRKLYDLSIADPQERMKKYNEAAKALAEETDKKVADILLPHQLKRLKQIAFQMQFQQGAYGANPLTGDQLASELNITEEQKVQLQEAQKKALQEMQEKTQAFYKQLQEEQREKILSVLTPEQRRKLEELTGEQFQWQPAARAQPAEPKKD
ncbi:hypothetical protein NA78x_001384 [Anatilimnocola sp. NA78]|uniref:hypothetical protein n=1 Tax=Anatilimnocola sp. NA78 TaxID=3415683 RepID=UPI003CE53DB0